MRILLTGGTGFIGSAFLRAALREGNEVVALIRPGKRPPEPVPANLRWLEGSLAETPWSAVAAFRPELCLHSAWVATPGVYLESDENHRLREWSRGFIRRAVESGVSRVIALGTCVEYRMQLEPLSEERTPLEPLSTYARCKDALRRELEADAKTQGFALCWARVFYPYGPGEHPARLGSALIHSLRRGERFKINSPASLRDYIYIEDLVAALLRLIRVPIAGAINLGTGEGVTVGLIARTLGEILARPELIQCPSPGTPDPASVIVADTARLRSLGWRPQVSLSDGLRALATSVAV